MDKITKLTATGEVAAFTDVNQFGGSVNKCGYMAVAQSASAAQPGATPQSASTVYASGQADYIRLAGPDVPSNPNGMSLWQCYSDLTFHKLHYLAGPTAWGELAAWLDYGYWVIVCVPESQVYDMEIKGSPYPWATANLNHIISLTGRGRWANSLKFRDTASIVAPDSLRPGPREYDYTRLVPYWAVIVLPSWLPIPPAGFDPQAASAGDEPTEVMPVISRPATLKANDDDKQVWSIVKPGITLDDSHAIPQSWLVARWKSSQNFGPPLEAEHSITRAGVPCIEQEFARARAQWNSKTGAVIWFDGRGEVKVS